MPATADGGQNSGLRGGADCGLYIAYIGAAGDQARRAGDHAIPNGAGVFVGGLAGAQQVAFELAVERRVDLFDGFAASRGPFTEYLSCYEGLRRRRCTYKSEIQAKKDREGRNRPLQSVYEESGDRDREKQHDSDHGEKRMGPQAHGQTQQALAGNGLRKRRWVLRITSHTKSIPATAVP